MSRVQSIERAFAVLGALADGPVGVSELAERVRLPKSTVARLLSALATEEAVEQSPGDPRYRLGGRLATLGASLRPVATLVAVAHPDLATLAADVGEAAGLAVADGLLVHYVDQVTPPNPVQVRDWSGTRVPMHAVPSGLVLLAHASPAAVDRYLAHPLERFTSRTLVDPAAVRERLRRIQLDGYAWVHEEFSDGIDSVAAAVADRSGEVVAAVHVHGPSYRFPPAGGEERIAVLVMKAAARVSGRLRQMSGRSGSG
ncbi:MAG: IclR family transcriptional regulator [Candidatus Limnocylindrales bacterium]